MTSQELITVSKGSWIIDSGATCHMCNDESQFIELKQLEKIQEVRLGDGRSLDGTAEGTVKLETLLPDGKTKNCTVENVLFVPKLSYSLLSVSKASNAGKTTVFDRSGCKILNEHLLLELEICIILNIVDQRLNFQTQQTRPTKKHCGIGDMVILENKTCRELHVKSWRKSSTMTHQTKLGSVRPVLVVNTTEALLQAVRLEQLKYWSSFIQMCAKRCRRSPLEEESTF